MLTHFVDLFRYNDWANNRLFETLLPVYDDLPDAAKLFSHILNGQEIWLTRLKGEPTPVEWNLWHIHDKALITNRLIAFNEDWHAYLDSLMAGDLETYCTYTTLTGQTFDTQIKDIFTHVVNHGTHHRAQIAMLLRQAGYNPPATDYITFTREP